ncbi:MAG: Hsp70 family protein [Deltaproteobacteria bacterium]|jgi:molecular chaperone DnaK (HSP70)|nr:Hsp70 family protein [Deltaproteobacteria bacterium]
MVQPGSNFLIDPALDRDQIRELIAKKTYIGVDFGTSTTVVSAIIKDENGQITSKTLTLEQPTELGGITLHHLVNSVLAWTNNRLLFGRAAYDLRPSLFEGIDVFSSFKMRLGIDIGPTYPQTKLKRENNLPWAIEDANDATREFIKCLLSSVKKAINTYGLPQDLCFAVSVPASFEANQRRDLLENLKAAGMPVLEDCLIDEPNAAFLSFLQFEFLNNSTNEILTKIKTDKANIVVYDFGAGTCDISILQVSSTNNNLKSRNLAISKFTALGGDDIDRAIVREILLEQLLKSSPGYSPEKRDLDEAILPRLQPAAERLKVAAFEWMDDRGINTLESMQSTPSEPFVVSSVPAFKVRKQELKLDKPQLTLGQLAKAVESFVGVYDPIVTTSHVFAPVDDAINKANLKKSEIDAVLFIGGSSANPLVQSTVMDKLPGVKAIVPKDLRSHVSLGSALHSFIYNAFGIDMIRPITSETIFLLTKGDREEVLVPASSEVPSPSKIITHFMVTGEDQKVIELPIFVSQKEKMLGIIKIDATKSGGFKLNERVEIAASLTHDKLLEIEAKIGEYLIKAALLNPLANSPLTPIEKEMLEAKQKFNAALLKYGTRSIPKEIVLSYAQAAYAAGAYELAAEMYGAVERLDPKEDLSVSMTCAYQRAGKSASAEQWAERAYQREPSALTAYNLSLFREGSMSEQLLRKALDFDPGYTMALYKLGKLLHKRQSPEGKIFLTEYVKKTERSLDFSFNTIGDLNDIIWAANTVGRPEIANKAERQKKSLIEFNKAKNIYDSDNLVESINYRSLVVKGD